MQPAFRRARDLEMSDKRWEAIENMVHNHIVDEKQPYMRSNVQKVVVRMVERQAESYIVVLRGEGCHYCGNKHGNHTGNRVYMFISRQGMVQRCHSPKAPLGQDVVCNTGYNTADSKYGVHCKTELSPELRNLFFNDTARLETFKPLEAGSHTTNNINEFIAGGMTLHPVAGTMGSPGTLKQQNFKKELEALKSECWRYTIQIQPFVKRVQRILKVSPQAQTVALTKEVAGIQRRRCEGILWMDVDVSQSCM